MWSGTDWRTCGRQRNLSGLPGAYQVLTLWYSPRCAAGVQVLLKACSQQAGIVASSVSLGTAGPGEVEGHACAVIQLESTGRMRWALRCRLPLGPTCVPLTSADAPPYLPELCCKLRRGACDAPSAVGHAASQPRPYKMCLSGACLRRRVQLFNPWCEDAGGAAAFEEASALSPEAYWPIIASGGSAQLPRGFFWLQWQVPLLPGCGQPLGSYTCTMCRREVAAAA